MYEDNLFVFCELVAALELQEYRRDSIPQANCEREKGFRPKSDFLLQVEENS